MRNKDVGSHVDANIDADRDKKGHVDNGVGANVGVE